MQIQAKDEIEIFKPITFNNNYEISNYGRVRIIQHRNKSKIGKFLAIRYGGYKKKYCRVSICNKDYYIHRLVLETFVGSKRKPYQAAHIDGNPLNNKLSNLTWTTPKENTRHKHKHGTSPIGVKNPMSKVNDHDVSKIRYLYSQEVHPILISKAFNIAPGYVSRIALYKTWKHVEIDNIILESNKKFAKKLISTSNDRKNISIDNSSVQAIQHYVHNLWNNI